MTIEKGGSPRVLEYQRTQPNVGIERFLLLHAGCNVAPKTEVLNSAEVDPSTGDPKPIFKEYFVCNVHNVRSASRDILEV
jgi:hypothetical protein